MSTSPVPPVSFGPPSGFACSWTLNGHDAALVHAAGELDVATAKYLAKVLDEAHAEARTVVLDVRDLSFMDSSGVHLIVDASARARHGGRRLVLVAVPPRIGEQT